MAKTKDGTQFDISTGEVIEAPPRKPSERKIEKTTSYGQRRIRVRTFNNDPSKTDPSQALETDVNYIMSKHRYRDLPSPQALYADLSEVGDLHDAHEAIQRADHAFNKLPARLRAKFENDPQQLIQFLSDPKNDAEAVHLGLKDEFTPYKPSTVVLDSEETKRSAVGPTTETSKKKDSSQNE